MILAFATENQLLNAVRQMEAGYPPFLAVDTTYRVVIEGHACMPIGTQDAANRFHTIGYGICSSEDKEAHTAVFKMLYDAVNACASHYKGMELSLIHI